MEHLGNVCQILFAFRSIHLLYFFSESFLKGAKFDTIPSLLSQNVWKEKMNSLVGFQSLLSGVFPMTEKQGVIW